MIVLVLDPSSQVCGYCLFDDEKLIEGGCIRPSKDHPDWWVRTASMCNQVIDTIREFKVDHVVIEDPGFMSRYSAKSYGVIRSAFGMFVFSAMRTGATVDLVPANVWTRGKSKSDRTKLSTMNVKYDQSKDQGQDAADALGLGLFWIKRRRNIASTKSR